MILRQTTGISYQIINSPQGPIVAPFQVDSKLIRKALKNPPEFVYIEHEGTATIVEGMDPRCYITSHSSAWLGRSIIYILN